MKSYNDTLIELKGYQDDVIELGEAELANAKRRLNAAMRREDHARWALEQAIEDVSIEREALENASIALGIAECLTRS